MRSAFVALVFAACLAVITANEEDAKMDALVEEYIEKYPVMMFSKSYCAFCNAAKELFRQLLVEPFALELDQTGLNFLHCEAPFSSNFQTVKGDKIQEALFRKTGQKSGFFFFLLFI